MDPWVGLLLFCLNIVDDGLAVLYIRRTTEGKAAQAAIFSGLLTAIVSFSVVSYVSNWRYLAPIVAGSMAGSFLMVKWDRRKK